MVTAAQQAVTHPLGHRVADLRRAPRVLPEIAPVDVAYVTTVDGLIPYAVAYADRTCPLGDAKQLLRWARLWNRAFHRAMDELTRRHGLRCQTWQIFSPVTPRPRR